MLDFCRIPDRPSPLKITLEKFRLRVVYEISKRPKGVTTRSISLGMLDDLSEFLHNFFQLIKSGVFVASLATELRKLIMEAYDVGVVVGVIVVIVFVQGKS